MDGYDKARVVYLYLLTGIMIAYVIQDMKLKQRRFESEEKNWFSSVKEAAEIMHKEFLEKQKDAKQPEAKPHLEPVK